jgi:thiosulfate reductase cytochrome b subunit
MAAHPVFEHPLAVRVCHWTNAVAIAILTLSGLRIFNAFPSFGPKIPEHDLIDAVPRAITLGGWLGGALQWHFTFMWIFAAGGILYVISQLASGHYRTVVFTKDDVPGVWPMVRHYFFFGPKPTATGQYNALQKLAYTTAIVFGAVSLLSGMVMYKPAQLSTPSAVARCSTRDMKKSPPIVPAVPSTMARNARSISMRIRASLARRSAFACTRSKCSERAFSSRSAFF